MSKVSAKRKGEKVKYNFTTKKNQRLFMDDLFVKFKLSNLEDWKSISKYKLVQNGGKALLQYHYKNNMNSLLSDIYPEHQWQFSSVKKETKNNNFNLIDTQREFFDNLYFTLKLSKLGEWKKISKNKIIKNGGKTILKKYQNNFESLLCSIYPYYPWKDEIFEYYQQEHFKSPDKQLIYMEKLFSKLHLKVLDDWLRLKLKGLKFLEFRKILKIYSNDLMKLLQTIYPNFPWATLSHYPFRYFQSIDHQRLFMDQIFHQYNLKSFDGWVTFKKQRLIENGAGMLLLQYKNDFKKLLSSVYPNYPFHEITFRSKSYFQSVNHQIEFFEDLLRKLKLKSIGSFQKLTKNQIIKYGGKSILLIYSKNLKRIFSSIFPNYPWSFQSKKKKLNELKTQRQFMDQLYQTFQFTTLDDWMYITKNRIIDHGGKSFFKNYYSNNLYSLLTTIYPYYPWDFFSTIHFKSIENQRQFMDYLYRKFDLKSMDDWMFVSLVDLKKNARKLLSQYRPFSRKRMLLRIYPDHDWVFEKLKSKEYLEKIENQRRVLYYLYRRFKLKSLDDWLKISRFKFIKRGGGVLLSHLYQNNMKKMFSSIYPNHLWCFNHLKYLERKGDYGKSFDYLSSKLLSLQLKFLVQQKRDWYRLNSYVDEINLFTSLKIVYPEEEWIREDFQCRSKKSNQRLLFTQLQRIYQSKYLIEDYRHPLLHTGFDHFLEFDVFIPSLNLAFEYQGEHHYNDIPAFGNLDTYQCRDRDKRELADLVQISLISIPYWWNVSPSTLHSSIQLQFLHKLGLEELKARD